MSKIPTVGMQRAFKELMTTSKYSVVFYTSHKLEYKYDPNSNVDTVLYYHYNTLIGYVEHIVIDDSFRIVVTNSGWSQTDAVNFTGLLVCMELNRVKCYRKDYTLYLSLDGKKMGVKEIILE